MEWYENKNLSNYQKKMLFLGNVGGRIHWNDNISNICFWTDKTSKQDSFGWTLRNCVIEFQKYPRIYFWWVQRFVIVWMFEDLWEGTWDILDIFVCNVMLGANVHCSCIAWVPYNAVFLPCISAPWHRASRKILE